MKTLVKLCAAAIAAALSSCSASMPKTTDVPTYASLQPVLAEKCARCHRAGGIGPFRIDDFTQAKAKAAQIAAAVETGAMPPYAISHDDSCGDFGVAETLTEAQKQSIIAWARGGAPEGEKTVFPDVPLPQLEGARELSTPTFAPVAQGGMLAQNDEYRCFLVPHGGSGDAFITGYDVQPTDARIVHHVLGFIIDGAKPSGDHGKTNREALQALDDASPDRAGWPCFGMADDQGILQVESVPIAWAPGQGIVEYPQGMGVPLGKDQLFVVQVHYNLADPTTHGATDATRVRLRIADHVERQLAFLLPDGLLQTLFGSTPDTLPAGASSTKYAWSMTGAQLGLGQVPYVDVMAVMPHMHQRGRKLELDFGDQCAARVDAWDFHWQHMYFYRDGASPRLTSQSTLKVTCEYDTSQDTSPVFPGWGSRNEMCLTVLMIALPPGI